MMRPFLLLAAFSTSFPIGAQQVPLEVVITPDAYYVGAVKSPLATPAVDEVVRAKPERVLLLTCVETPPRKILQFEIELKARHPVDMAIAFSDKLCLRA